MKALYMSVGCGGAGPKFARAPDRRAARIAALPRPALYGIYKNGGVARRQRSPTGGIAMPTYSFECKKCRKRFQEILTFREYEAGKRKCPKCGSRDVVQVLEVFYAKTSRKA
jgi:putative FmdB family regulatory protein